MPYSIEMRDNNQHCVVKKDTGETVACHNTHDEDEKHLAALESNVPDARAATYRRYGGTVQSKGDGRIGGYGVHYNGPENRDLYQTYFDKRTEYFRQLGYPIVGERLLYNHGLEEGFRGLPIGVIDFVDERDVGIWIEAQLHDRAEYERMLKEYRDSGRWEADDEEIAHKAALIRRAVDALIESGHAALSSGSREHLVKFSGDGHADEWPIIEMSVTLTPGKAEGTEIKVIRSAFEQLQDILRIQAPNTAREGIDPERATPVGDVEPNRIESVNGVRNMEMADVLLAIQQMVGEALAGMKPPGEEQAEMAMDEEEEEEIRQETEEELEEEVRQMEEEDEEEVRNLSLDKLAEMVFKKIETKVAKRNEKKRKAAEAMRRQMKEWQREQPARRAPGYGNGSGNAPHPVNIDVGEELRTAHLSALDMAMAWKMATSLNAAQRPRGFEGYRATDFVSESFYRAAMAKMLAHVEKNPLSRPHEQLHLRSIQPFRADEINASDITGKGLEWLGTVYDSQVWELARNQQIYQLMQSRGMIEKEVPPGMKSVEVPIEGVDPTVYGGIEANDLDATNRPETVYKTVPLVSAEVTVTPGTFRAATAHTFVLSEDSYVDWAQEANRKLLLAHQENIEKAFINGDTETAGSTNINNIDGTPTTGGLTKDYYLEFNGLRKSPLITSTAFSADGENSLSVDLYRKAWELLGSAQAARKQNLFFLIDFFTQQGTYRLPDLQTWIDEKHNTVFTGELEQLWGIPVYMSGFMTKSNTAGKVATVTPTNNTRGQILCVYAPYWAFSYKRNITIEPERIPDSEVFAFYASARFSLTRRSASAASIIYNVAVPA